MIKFIVEGRKKLIGFGLSLENIRLLQTDEPIVADLTDMGLPETRIMIFYGETEKAMYTKLKSMDLIGPNTKVNIDPKAET